MSGLASRSAISRAPAGVLVRSMAASTDPARSPESVRVSSRLARVAASISRFLPRARRGGGREPRRRVDLGALDIGERQRRGSDLRARKLAETVEGLDAVEFARLAAPRRRGRSMSGPNGAAAMRDLLDQARKLASAKRFPARRSRWARGGRSRPQPRLVGLGERKSAGGDVERGEAERALPSPA